MSIAENSILLRFLLGIWQVLAGAWGEGAVGRVFARIGRAICRWVQGSALCQFVWREGTLPKSWRESVSCSLFTLILNLPCTLVRWIYRVGKGVWDGSLVFRALSAMGGASFFLMGLFLLVMLIAPHQIWNNAYGLLGAVGVTALFVVGSPSGERHLRALYALLSPVHRLRAGGQSVYPPVHALLLVPCDLLPHRGAGGQLGEAV